MFCSFLQNVEEEDCLDPHLLMMMMMMTMMKMMMTMQMRMRITVMNPTAMKERMALCKNWFSHEQKYLSP